MFKQFHHPLMWLLLGSLLLLTACATAPEAPASETDTETQPIAETENQTAPDGAAPPPGYDGQAWADILAEAEGQTVNWYMWGGQDNINSWVTDFVGQTVQDRYGITLNMVPVTDIVEGVNKVLGEKEAGLDDDGSIDLMWINGENFRTLRQANLLYGPWAQFLPNTAYVNWDDPSVSNDLGFPVDYYESPYGKAQFVLSYDSARVETPPATIEELIAWIEANPGLFTYPAPPDFTGTAFMMHICYWAAGGHEQFLGEFDQALFDEKFAPCWDTLNALEPHLWRAGETYPETHARHQDLFANGEVYFEMAYNPAEASSHIASGKFPETTRTFVFDTGTIANTHYVGIPYNSPNKAAAMVVANFLLSPEAQYSKRDINNWGDMPAIEITRLSEEWQDRFAGLPRGPATLPDDILSANRLPELQAAWRIAAEQAWEENVLKR